MGSEFFQQQLPVLQGTLVLRDQMMAIITRENLAFSPGGTAMTLGELCKEMGEVEYAYLESFKTFKQDWSYRNETPGLAADLDQLKAWFAELDATLVARLEAMSDADFQRPVERGPGFNPPAAVQFHIYCEALLIFYGKASIYLRALNKPLPEQWQTWIG